MRPALFAAILLTVITAAAQVEKIIIPAGTPEDQAIQAITNETDAQKRLTMLQDFVQKFSSNPQAIAYGDSQLSQLYLDQGDTGKALEYGEKALAAQPRNLEILVSVASVAQNAKASEKVVDCAATGSAAFNGIAKQPKPEGMADDQFAAKVQQDQEPFRSSYEYLETAGLNAIMGENDAKKRMNEVERYMAAFPGGRFEEQIMQLAVYTLGQLKDSARLASFSEKALAANPKSVSTLVVLADAFADFPEAANAVRAENYARKAIELSKVQTGGDPGKLHLYSGLAHSALGYSLMKQDKIPAAIPELKAASSELKDNPEAYSVALYRLGYAYTKSNKVAEAKATLAEAASVKGPYQDAARDLLAKVQAAAAGAKPPARAKK